MGKANGERSIGKNINRFLKIKIKRKEKRKRKRKKNGKLHRTAKSQCRSRGL